MPQEVANQLWIGLTYKKMLPGFTPRSRGLVEVKVPPCFPNEGNVLVTSLNLLAALHDHLDLLTLSYREQSLKRVGR